MSELHRAVQAEIDAFRPDVTPPLTVIRDRKRARDRRRYGASALALSVLAAAGAVVASGAGAGVPDRLPSFADPEERSAAGEQVRRTFDITYRDAAGYEQDRDAPRIERCFALPGSGGVAVRDSVPPQYAVTVTGEAEITGFRNCLGTLSNVRAVETGGGPSRPAAAADLLLTVREADQAESGFWQRTGQGGTGVLLDPCDGGTPPRRDRDHREQAGVELRADRETSGTRVVQQATLYRSADAAATAFDDIAAAVRRCSTRAESSHRILMEEVRDGVRSLLVQQELRCAGCSDVATHYVVQQVEEAVAILRVSHGADAEATLDSVRGFSAVLADRLASAVRS
jgi:hypothetical protein